MTELKREQFKNNIDWVNYKVTGRVPSYLESVGGACDGVSVIKYNTKTKNKDRCAVIVRDENSRRTLCNCYQRDFDKVKKEFLERYDGDNFIQLRDDFRREHNIKIRNGRNNGRLEDCNIWFGRHHGDDRLDALTYMNGKKISVCRCYEHQEDEVREKFNAMKNDGRYTLEGICKKMGNEYNLHKRRRTKRGKSRKTKKAVQHSIEITENGLIYRDGEFVKTNNDLYRLINSMIE